MRFLLPLVLIILTGFNASAVLPFNNETEARFAALEAGTHTLTNGKVEIGNASNVAVGVTPSGDVTIDNLGVTAIGAGKVLESMITVTNNKVLIGNGSNVAVARTLSGDVTNTNTGVTAIGAGKVLESMLAVGTADGLNAKRVARATYDCATSCTVGAHTLGVTLPANALIIRSYIYVVTQMVDTGTCTIAYHCEDANNIKTATDLTGSAAGAFIEGASTGAISAAVGSISAPCLITATTADGGSCVPSAGKHIVFVEYVVGA